MQHMWSARQAIFTAFSAESCGSPTTLFANDPLFRRHIRKQGTTNKTPQQPYQDDAQMSLMVSVSGKPAHQRISLLLNI